MKEEMRSCPYCLREDGASIKPHYAEINTSHGKTWVAYCPRCRVRTNSFSYGMVKTIEQAKAAWNRYAFYFRPMRAEDIPMQFFSED